MKSNKYYPWILVGLLWGVGLLNYLDRQILSTMRPAIQVDITELRSATNFGYLMGIFLWVYGLMSPVAGMIADRVNRKWLIVASLLVWSGVTFGMGYATSLPQLYVLRALMGFSEALYIPAALALIADFHEKRTRSLALGIHMTGLYLGSALGGFGATVSSRYSWHLTFHGFGLVGILYAGVLILLLKERDSHQRALGTASTFSPKSIFSGWSGLFSKRVFWILLFAFASASLPGWASKNWLPTLFAQHLNLPMSQAGPLATITIAAASLLGVVTGGFLSDRWVLKNVRGRIHVSVMGLSVCIPALLLLGYGHSYYSLLTAGVCFGLGFGLFDANTMAILCQFVSNRYRATAYGLMNMVGVLSGALVTDLFGQSSDEGHLGEGFAMLAGIVLLAAMLQWFLLKPATIDFAEKENTLSLNDPPTREGSTAQNEQGPDQTAP